MSDLSDLTADQEKRLRDCAQLEQGGAYTAIEVVKRIRGPRFKQGINPKSPTLSSS